MDLGIKGLRVIITAGAAGIGREVARTFLREDAQVHICDVDRTALAELATSDPKLKASLCDVSDRDAVIRFIDATADALGGLDCLVNNAGIARPRSLSTSPDSSIACARRCGTSPKAAIRRSSIYPRPRAASVFPCARPTLPRNGRWSVSPSRSPSSLGRKKFASMRSSPARWKATAFVGSLQPRDKSAAYRCRPYRRRRCRMRRLRK